MPEGARLVRPGPSGLALEWAQGNWSAGPGASPGGFEGEEGDGSGSGQGGDEWSESDSVLSAIWETEGLQTVGIVVLVVASIKLLHILGIINFSEGKTPRNKCFNIRGVPSKCTKSAFWGLY